MSRTSQTNLKAIGTKGAVTVIYKKSGGLNWAKTYPTKQIAVKSATTLKSNGHKVIAGRVAKGFKFGAVIKRANGTAYTPTKAKRKSRKK